MVYLLPRELTANARRALLLALSPVVGNLIHTTTLVLRYFITSLLPKFKKLIRLCLPVTICLSYVSYLPFPHPIVFVCGAKLGKAKDLADRYRKLQALAEGSASELADAYQREKQHLSEASAMREELARATARAEEFAEDLRVARAREVYMTRRVEELEAVEEEQRAVVEAEMESVRRELDRACGAEQDAAGEIERLAAQLESAQDGASSEAATLREQMAAAEGARQAAVLRATSLEEEVSGLRASAAEAAVAAKTVEVEAREEAARLSRELDVATEAAAAEDQRAKILTAELANVKAAAVTAEESTKAAVAEAVERAEAEREKAVGNVKTIRILEEQTMMARRTAEEAQSRLEAMGTEAEALREKAQTSEGRVAKVGIFFLSRKDALYVTRSAGWCI